MALGALLQLLVRDLATGLGLTGLVVSPAFGYAGVGFPTLGINTFAQIWGAILPVRWYMAVLLGQAARGLPVAEIPPARSPRSQPSPYFYSLFAVVRLRFIARNMTRAAPAPVPASAPAARRRRRFRRRVAAVLAIRGAFILLMAPPSSTTLFPQPYLNQILRKIPIAVVDNDLSELSRRIVETLDASDAVKVVGVVRTTEVRIAPEVGRPARGHQGAQGRIAFARATSSPSCRRSSSPRRSARRGPALDAATADRNNVYAGVRAEQIATLAAEIAKAKSRSEYAQQQLSRTAHTGAHRHRVSARSPTRPITTRPPRRPTSPKRKPTTPPRSLGRRRKSEASPTPR